MNFPDIFKALADGTRLRIFNIILSVGGPVCVCEIVDALKLPQYLISKHLNVLKNYGLIKSKKDGRWVYYSLDEKGTPINKEFFAFLKKSLKGKALKKDRKKLKSRLALRNNDRCAIGF